MHSPPPKLSRALLRRIERSVYPPAVVIGTGPTGLSIARALHRHGVPVIGLDDDRVSHTSYSNAFEFIRYPKLYDLEVVDFLGALATRLPRKAALFCSGDEHVLLLSKIGASLLGAYDFELPTPENVEVLMNKHLFAEVARERGWLIPATHYCESLAELDAFLEDLTFPVILKPRLKNRESRTHSPQKTYRCETADSLRAAYQLLAQWEPEAVIQQWIPGGDDEIYFSFHYFDGALRELTTFEGRKLRQYIPECGSTSCAVGVAEPRVTERSREILRTLGSVGFCSVEYKRDPRDGRYYIMEPTTGRVNLQVGVALANGVDLIGRAYAHLTGVSLPPDGPRTHHVKWVLLPQDLRSARFYVKRGDLTWRGYFDSIRGDRVIFPFSARDPQVLGAFLADYGKRAARKIARKTGLARNLEPAARGESLLEPAADAVGSNVRSV